MCFILVFRKESGPVRQTTQRNRIAFKMKFGFVLLFRDALFDMFAHLINILDVVSYEIYERNVFFEN